MDSFARLVIKIAIAAKKAAAAGSAQVKNPTADGDGGAAKIKGKGKKKPSPLSLKVKLLYLLTAGFSRSSDIITELCIKKSNLALLIRELIAEKLILKRPLASDKRVIILSPTSKGIAFLEEYLSGLTAAASSAFGSGCEEAAQKLEEAVKILEFL